MNKHLTTAQLRPLFLAFLAITAISNTILATASANTPANINITVKTMATNITTGLIAHWPLDENTGTIAEDSSGHNHTGTLMNKPTWSDNWLNFDGNNDYVDMGILDVTGESMTLSAWFRSDRLNNCSFHDCRIISKAKGVLNKEHYWMVSTVRVGNKTRLRFRLKTKHTTTTLIAHSGDIMEDELVHVAAVYDGAEMRLYKNGVEVGRRSKSGTINTNPKVSVWVGGNPKNATNRPWRGQIGDVRIYNRVLTSQEIQTAAASSTTKAGNYALFFEHFLDNKYYIAKLDKLGDDNPPLINPVEINMQGFVAELGNPDVSFDGKTIVFSALVSDDWNIYRGDLDVVNAAITNIEPFLDITGIREEDPRISWNGQEVVYKCDGDVCIADLDSPGPGTVIVSDPCELYGPVINSVGTTLAYTKRCADQKSDRVVIYDIDTDYAFQLESEGNGPDRFPHFLADGRLLYSHLDDVVETVSLWKYDLYGPNGLLGLPSLFHSSGSVSDDDSYAHKQNREYIFFLGFNIQTDLYDLYVYRESSGDSIKLSENQPMLGTVVFRHDDL